MPPSDQSASITELAHASASVTARVIANFAWQHLKASITFREHVRDLEARHAKDGFGPHFEDVRSYASACLMSAASSLEALVNELFIDPNCGLRSTFTNFEDEFWGRRGVERKPVLEKYQLALDRLSLRRIDETSSVFQDASDLLELRHALVHYKPTWDPDRPPKATLTSRLAGRYPISPFLTSRDDFATMQSMSFGCCKWAIESTFAFIREFDSRTHLNDQKMLGFWRIET